MPASCETALQQRLPANCDQPGGSRLNKNAIFWRWKLKTPCLIPPCRKMPARRWMKVSFAICLRGTPPFKPRYVLPDYARFLANGSQWLELEGAKDLDDALSLLTILYHHVSFRDVHAGLSRPALMRCCNRMLEF
ncbi:putative PFL-like glycyl radical enzyme [Salmonella enterica subsp. enterica]|uniref:Putative PFL-like glycyl radical enzyme n=1 Tax=Salmonella enterica I TaxID=59201 RepID=A0A447TNH2_SALET|nr:putative PFL-like glycyl radical enzyme [Salmonella enterica subsp. enterica]